jgi:hypothetical protein
MTTLIEGKNSFFLNSPAILIDEGKDVASNWASEHIVANTAIKWILAKYVEADNANSNGQYWTLDDLRLSKPTIQHSPMNIDHHSSEIVGTWTAAELLYPTEGANVINPYIETLGAFWKHYFPEKMAVVEEAFNTGQLYVSMECVGDSVTCVGTDDACGESFAYKGPFDDSYCDHIKERAAHRQINNPHFLGGALIVPPNKPGWKSASVNELSSLDTDKLVESIANDNPEGSEEQWITTMNSLIFRATLDRFSKIS